MKLVTIYFTILSVKYIFFYWTKACPGCGIGSNTKEMFCTHYCGYLASPNYPSLYPDNINVTWSISVTEDNYIRLEFKEFLVESSQPDCSQDFAEIYNILRDGSKSLMGRYCEPSPPPSTLVSGMNRIILVFRSDQQYSSSGFFGQYSSEHYQLPQYIMDKLHRKGMIMIITLVIMYCVFILPSSYGIPLW